MKEIEKVLAQVPDNRKEITELAETELKELEKVANQYGRDSFEYHKCLMHFKHVGEEIPEDVQLPNITTTSSRISAIQSQKKNGQMWIIRQIIHVGKDFMWHLYLGSS